MPSVDPFLAARDGEADEGAGTPSLLQRFLARSPGYAALPRVSYTPCFGLEPVTPAAHATGTEWYYLCDRGERIGLIETWKREIEMFRFRPAGENRGGNWELPEVYHWANLQGARIQLYGTQMLPPVTSFRLTVAQDRGAVLVLQVEQQHQGGIAGASEYRLAWDERLGYVWTCRSTYRLAQPRAVEFNNLYARGVSESRDDHKQWQKTLRARADGQIAFVYHNPLHLPTDAAHRQGFVGFVTEPEMNPFVDLVHTSGPVTMFTCSQWYDQHLVLDAPAAPMPDGGYQVQAQYRFLSLPGGLARELEAMAVAGDDAVEVGWRTGFLAGRVNDFETPVPRHCVYNGPLWHGVEATPGCARSGQRSIHLTGPGLGQELAVTPTGAGPAIYGQSDRQYRLAAWVRTRGLLAGGAWLQVDDVRFNWQDVQATHASARLAGDCDWTRLEVDFRPAPHDPFLLIKLCVAGTGEAWFDDLELTEQDC
jgi:hypothetical protein